MPMATAVLVGCEAAASGCAVALAWAAMQRECGRRVKVSGSGAQSERRGTALSFGGDSAGLAERMIASQLRGLRLCERLSGEACSYTADLWAVGLILIELASSRYPYGPAADGDGESFSFFQLLAAILEGPAPSLPAHNVGDAAAFSHAFADFVSVCLEKEPLLRPTARELLGGHPFLRGQIPTPAELS